MKRGLIVALLCAGPASASAQQFEVAPLVNIASASGINRRAEGVDDLLIRPSVGWGAHVDYFFTSHVGLEFLSTYESTSVGLTTTSGDSAELFRMSRGNGYANVVYQFHGELPDRTPFVFGGIGATHFRSSGLQDETRPSWTAGAGMKWFVTGVVGVEVRGAYVSTHVHDSTAAFCDPFGFCQEVLRRVEATAGVAFRF
jgi:hypothetical protein